MMSLKMMMKAVELEVQYAPAFVGDDADWDKWFARNARHFGRVIGSLIMKSGAGTYTGEVGNHSLDMCDVFVISDDGYRGLLMQWLGAARDALEHRAA